MTPIKEPGTAKRYTSAYLFPEGAACEKVKGISHLFEHMLIGTIRGNDAPVDVTGHTTEDYVIIFCNGIPPGDMRETLHRMRFTKENVFRHKQLLIMEIESESTKDEEAFFRLVWQGTDYAKSPLGTVEDASVITPAMLEALRLKLLHEPLFYFNADSGSEIITGQKTELPRRPEIDIPRRRRIIFQDRHYDICYFENVVESCHFLTRILKNLNPDKHIQLSEKKWQNALILETGTTFPDKNNIDTLRKEAHRQINADIREIKKNINEMALNELESFYYCGKHWQDRIAELDKTTNRQLLDLTEELKQ